MAIRELAVFPQTTYSAAQGIVGVRKWALDHNDDIMSFVSLVANSHFPTYPDMLPVQIQTGEFWEGVQVKREADTNPRYRENMGYLPHYNKILVVATYVLHRAENCWPKKYRKPYHPYKTTLNMRIRGSGQALLVAPAGMRLTPITDETCSGGGPSLQMSSGTRIIVPVTEYHISCDRMTKDQVDAALDVWDWDLYQGNVNADAFLSAPPGTLLFDGYEITETFAASTLPHRYCMTACLKQRVITDNDGTQLYDAAGNAIGWNHDFVAVKRDDKQWDWMEVRMKKRTECLYRYAPVRFAGMFGVPDDAVPTCTLTDQNEIKTVLDDCEICGLASPTLSVSSAGYEDDPTGLPTSYSSGSIVEPESSSSLPPCTP